MSGILNGSKGATTYIELSQIRQISGRYSGAKVPSKAKSNFRRKTSSFRVSQDSKLFKVHTSKLIKLNYYKYISVKFNMLSYLVI